MRPVDDSGSNTASHDNEALRQRVGYLEALVQRLKEQLKAFRQQISAIVDHPAYTSTDKLVAVKVRLCADDCTLDGAYPSYSTLMQTASVKDDRTVKRSLDKHVRSGLLNRQYRHETGQPPIYGFSKQHLQALITEHIERGRQKNA